MGLEFKPKCVVRDDNILSLQLDAVKVLENAGMHRTAEEMTARVKERSTNEERLAVIQSYVELV